jgi:hypothetical protein
LLLSCENELGGEAVVEDAKKKLASGCLVTSCFPGSEVVIIKVRLVQVVLFEFAEVDDSIENIFGDL